MKNTLDIFGTNQNTQMQNHILQGYACIWIFGESRVVFGTDGQRLETVSATPQTLDDWVKEYESIDVKVWAKKQELEKIQQTYKQIKGLQDKIYAENKLPKPNQQTINNLKTQIETLNQQININFPWVVNATKWLGDKFIWAPKIAAEAVGGFALGILDSVGGGTLVNGIQNTTRELYLKATSSGDLLLTAGGIEGKGFSFDEFVDQLAEGEKVKAIKQIMLHAQEQNPPITVDYQVGNYQFVQDGSIVKLGRVDCIKDQKIMIAAFSEHLMENPNFGSLEAKQALIDTLKDSNGIVSKDTTLDAMRARLKSLQNGEIDLAALWTLWTTLETQRKDLQELQADADALAQEIAALENEIAWTWGKKAEAYEIARTKAGEDVLFLLRQELIREQLEKGINDYGSIDDMILTRIWKGSVRFLKWISGIKGWIETIPNQINSIDQLTTFVVEVKPLPADNPDGQDHSFANILPTFTEFLGDEFKLDPNAKGQIENKLKDARRAYLETIYVQADPAKMEALNQKKTEQSTKLAEIETKQQAVAKLEAEYVALEKIDVENAAALKLLETPLGKWIMECDLNDQINQDLWKKLLYDASDYQEGKMQTIAQTNDKVTDALKYKPSLSENVISAIEDLPPLAKIGGVVIALMMMKNSGNFGKVLGGLAMAGIAGEVITKVATDGEKGVFDFLEEKAKGLTDNTKDMIAKIHNVEARNAILKFLENSPQENAKPAMVLTQIMGDKITDFVNGENLIVNGPLLMTTETYYQAVRSRGNRAGDMGRFFDKNGIKKEDFDKAIQIMFAEAAPDSAVQKSAEGYQYVQDQIKNNPSWKHFTVIDVVANSMHTHLTKVPHRVVEATETEETSDVQVQSELISEVFEKSPLKRGKEGV